MKVVMYHYVREFSFNLPKLKFLNFSNFQKQLDYFEENYEFMSHDEFQKFCSDGYLENYHNKILLTFDDGMSCHYDFVFHELKKRKLWGIFFIATDPYSKEEMLNVHKLHKLLAVHNSEDVHKELKNVIDDSMMLSKQTEKFDKYTYVNQSNEHAALNSKRLFNYFVKENFKKEVINEVAKAFKYKFLLDEYYVSEKNLKIMAKSNMVIGSQTESHPVMANLSYEEQDREIKNSFEYINSMFPMSVKTYCHPFGSEITYNQNTINLLNNYNVDCSFAVNPIDISYSTCSENKRHTLPRYDCNEFIYGNAD